MIEQCRGVAIVLASSAFGLTGHGATDSRYRWRCRRQVSRQAGRGRAQGRPPGAEAGRLDPAAIEPNAASATQIRQSLVGHLEVAGYRGMLATAGLGEAVRLAREGPAATPCSPRCPRATADRIGLIGDLDTITAAGRQAILVAHFISCVDRRASVRPAAEV